MLGIIPMRSIIPNKNLCFCGTMPRIIIMCGIVRIEKCPSKRGAFFRLVFFALFDIIPHTVYAFVDVRFKILHNDESMRRFIGGILSE